MRFWCLFLTVYFLLLSPLHAEERGVAKLYLVPVDGLILNPTNEGRRQYDTVVHGVVVAATGQQPITLESLELSVLSGGQKVLTKLIAVDRMLEESGGLAEMSEMGLEAFIGAQLLNENGLTGVVGQETKLAGSSTLNPGEALMTGRHHFSIDFPADALLATARLVLPDGSIQTVSRQVVIAPYESHIRLSSPLEGTWVSTASTSIEGHHRLNPGTEFAVDFFKLDGDGMVYKGDEMRAENYYGFGAPVYAAADGEVVFVISDDIQDRAELLPQEGESDEAAGQRISMASMMRMQADFPRALAGNLVVLRHSKDDEVIYTSYGHLAAGSVGVKKGDLVNRGTVIGKVGDTGDSPTVHLHFQVNQSDNPFFSKSLPAAFDDTLKDVNEGADPLKFVVGTSGGKAK